MTDQRIAEIQEALERYDRADDAEEMSRASHVISLEAHDWLSYLLSELDKWKKEASRQYKFHNETIDENRKLREERDKLRSEHLEKQSEDS